MTRELAHRILNASRYLPTGCIIARPAGVEVWPTLLTAMARQAMEDVTEQDALVAREAKRSASMGVAPADLSGEGASVSAEASPDPLETTHAAWRALAGSRSPNLSPAAADATMRAIKAEGSFTFTTSTMTTAWRSPPIGALRRWARSTSRTPWRRRSIASWRSAWRKVHGRVSLTITNVEIHPSWNGVEFQGSIVAQLVGR